MWQAWDYRVPSPSPAPLPPLPRRLDPEAAIGHLDRLYAAARALSGDPHLAEDLVQDTYAAVLSRPRWLSGSDELGYLLRALRNRWRDELRTRARRPQPLSLDDGSGEPLRATTPAPHAALDGRAVLDAVHELPSPYRETLVAIDVLGLSYAEGGQALGVPTRTATSGCTVAARRSPSACARSSSRPPPRRAAVFPPSTIPS